MKKSMKIELFKSKFMLLLIAVLSVFCMSGCGGGGGGGGSSVLNPDSGSSSTSLNNGLTALNSADPNYAAAKSQLSLVVADANATAADKTIAYSGLGWTNLKASSGPSDVEQAITNFSNSINLSASQSAIDQAYVGRCVSQIIKDSASISSAINDLNAAGFSSLEKTYSDDKIKTGVSSSQVRGLKAFLHLIRNESSDAQLFTDNYNKLSSQAAGDRNAELMLNALDLMLKEN